MKKINIFGKEISIFIVMAMMLVVSASAALVTYLSNQTEAEVSVESPFEVKTIEGAQYSGSTSEVTGISWDADDSISFAIYGGETVIFTNYVHNMADVTIPVNDKEVIEHIETADMTGLDQEFTYYGARYWRPEGTPSATGSLTRLASYGGDVTLGWDPYTYDNAGTIECYSPMDVLTRTNDISGESYVDVRDDICYYVDAAFSFAVESGALVSDYPYDHYVGGFEEIMQLVITFNPAITPGTYRYTRQINVQS